MAQKTRPSTARRARGTGFIKGVFAFVFAAAGYTSTIVDARSPEPELAYSILSENIPATLNYSGRDVTITGSVGNLFTGPTFSGPNRLDKRSRHRPEEDGIKVAQSFDHMRSQLAELRDNPKLLVEKGATYPVAGDGADGPRIKIAAIDPALMSAALDAIDNLDNSTDPAPLLLPQRLAYARANTPATIFETPISRKVSERDLWCLASAVYFEARGESYRGQVAVAQVVMNRVNHKLYPNNICGVVFQNQTRRNACQFSFACDGKPEHVNDRISWAQAHDIAKKVTNGTLYLTEVANATHYHATYVWPHWAPRMRKVTKIGLHVFYRFRHG